ncbi:large subunit ribosomal protein L11e [Nematocida parisii]|uniref:Ribosomal protein L11 n=1 Tax=Nematocida parisii (strain ERTm3) TaxID=935791 RepID=I3EE02_NEMP3|nr:ribosomal protein L11 [Nematocida parisii ERTm1]EIJ87449.1 ribosomal protein L11 [Nematocida parisii ERTm3]KAI5127097.1 large subunit ribosomal protein L11e [Nematocida parisii]EIJ94529.1 ribosomal protein L11 [Nematocida parisii ERTm1]KAI5127644.1 large subunit ribosomal protein L11e [Nematocida parisii]KAI5141197.1 large subunit ribosomal protein L11e [Nematocida parisii]|eukprot:XP_013057885.1 ribosomal protein L11 [Nematocida parisii ERTm1]
MERKENPMKQIKLEKICLNICTGKNDDSLNKAAKVLEQLSGQSPVFSKAKITLRAFGIRRNEKIATNVVIRGEKAMEVLTAGLRVKEYELPYTCFSSTGTFGFGIQEHIDLGIKYDTNIGIFGMDFSVVLAKPGKRVSQRRKCKAKVGKNQRVSRDEAINWFRTVFDGTVLVEKTADN